MQSKYIIAGLLILLGTALLLDQYHVWTFGKIISTWWPLILIGIGISSLVSSRGSSISGYMLLLIGAVFQAQRLDLVSGNIWSYLWPLVLIFIGLHILFSHKDKQKTKFFSNNKSVTDEEKININTVFSGIEQKIDSQNFNGGYVSAVFAGIELDLRQAKISQDKAFLELNVVFGEIVVRVPHDILIDVSGSPFLGGFENKTHQITSPQSRVLKIKYSAVFGSIELTN
jgi:predicted membrane protein